MLKVLDPHVHVLNRSDEVAYGDRRRVGAGVPAGRDRDRGRVCERAGGGGCDARERQGRSRDRGREHDGNPAERNSLHDGLLFWRRPREPPPIHSVRVSLSQTVGSRVPELVPPWYRLLRPMRPDRPEPWAHRTSWTLADTSTRSARRLGAE